MSDVNTMLCRVIRYTERGEWHTLLVQREPANKYEGEHVERLIFPVDVSPFVHKKADAQAFQSGAWVRINFSIMGREYKEKHYVSISANGIALEVPAAEPAARAEKQAPEDSDNKCPF